MNRKILAALAALLPFVAQAQPYLGDFTLGDTIHYMWNSFDSSGASITRSTDGSIVVYEDNSTTEITDGGCSCITDTEDFDSLVGVHAVDVDTTGTGFESGKSYTIALQAATIDTQTVNAALAHFSIAARSTSPIVTGIAAATNSDATDIGLTTAYSDDQLNNTIVCLRSGTGAPDCRLIQDYNGTSGLSDVDTAFSTDPTDDSQYSVFPAHQTLLIATNGIAEVNPTYWNSVALASTNPLPNAAAGANGGLPTVNASNYVAGIQGTANTLDDLNDPTAAAIRSEIDSNSTQLAAIVADTNELQMDDVPGLIAGLNDPTAAAIVAALLGESCAAPGAGTIEEQLCTDLDAILVDTAEIGTAGAGLTNVGLGTDAVDADALSADARQEIWQYLIDSTTVEDMLCYMTAAVVNKSEYNTGTKVVQYKDAAGTTTQLTVTLNGTGSRTDSVRAGC